MGFGVVMAPRVVEICKECWMFPFWKFSDLLMRREGFERQENKRGEGWTFLKCMTFTKKFEKCNPWKHCARGDKMCSFGEVLKPIC